MTVLICSRTKSINYCLLTVSVSYLSKNCTTCLFISKSFKELFFMAFFSKADAKVRLIFEPPKLFEVFFKKVFFEAVRFKTSSLFSISTHLRFSLESGCKITALRHILQTSATLFSYFFAVFPLSHWFSKYAVEQIFKASIPVNKASYLNIYTRARIYRGFPKTTCISYTQKTSCRFTINNGVWYTGYFLHTSYTTKKMTVFFKNMTAF
mgnify:CR=1 FL=1